MKASDILVAIVGITVCLVVLTVVLSATVLQRPVPDLLLGATITIFTSFATSVVSILGALRVGKEQGKAEALEALSLKVKDL